MARKFVHLFAVWVLLGVLGALLRPSAFAPYGGTIVPMLGVAMLGMGVTLRWEDFRSVFVSPRAVWVGTLAQFFWMPLVGWLLAKILRLGPEIAVGEVLVGACPGGTASNVLTYLAGGDVALAVSMTAITTLLSPFLTPLLTYLYAHTWVQVPVWGLFLKILQVIFIPIGLGLFLRRAAGRFQGLLLEWMPAVSVCGIVWIISVIVALNRETILRSGAAVFAAVALHNLLGMVLGYWTARCFGLSTAQVKAVAIEVAVQDSGLGVALAKSFFGAAAALPSALFSVWQNLSGPVAAWVFSRRPTLRQ